MQNLSFIGLGVMGFPMGGYLAQAGYDLCVYNRTASKAKAWQDRYGGNIADTPQAAATGAQVVFTCVGNDDDLRSVTMGATGAFHGMAAGSYFVDHSTVSADVTYELVAEADKRGIHYIDAPVSGGQAGAESGSLTVMCGANSADFESIKPYIDSYAKKCVLIGECGAGQLAKMVNQICIAGLVQGLSEAIAFGLRAGLDMPKVIETISSGAAQSWQMDNRAATMINGEFDFGFAVDWMRKDLRICSEQARSLGAHLPVTALVDQFYSQLQELGGGRMDSSALIRLLWRDAE